MKVSTGVLVKTSCTHQPVSNKRRIDLRYSTTCSSSHLPSGAARFFTAAVKARCRIVGLINRARGTKGGRRMKHVVQVQEVKPPTSVTVQLQDGTKNLPVQSPSLHFLHCSVVKLF